LQIWTKGVDPVASALWTSAGAAVAFAIAAAIARQPFPSCALLPAAGLGVATAIAFITLYAGIARIGSSRTAISAMLEPVTTVVLGAIFLNEILTWRIGLGAALIVSSLPVLALTTRKGGVSAPPAA
jgi:drug/metabolite transporter (DMT)-like permease